MIFIGNNEDATVAFCCFNIVAPRSVHKDFLKGHVLVWVGGVRDWDVNVKVLICDTSDGNGDEVVKVFVVLMDEVTVGFWSNDGDDAAKGELNVGNLGGWFSKQF